MWVRGLKPARALRTLCAGVVAPYVGAWIETSVVVSSSVVVSVAPYVGAWIETYYQDVKTLECLVAPYVGAWIETS